MGHHTNHEQYNNTSGQVTSSDIIKYDRDLQQNDLLSPTHVFYTEPGSDSPSPLIPASMEEQGSSNVPLFMLRSKPPATRTEVSTYRDFSRIMKKEDAEFVCLEDIGSSTKLRRNARRFSFPKILHEILSRDDVADIISWCPHGRAWRLHKPKALEDYVLPQYFRRSKKYSSFTRRLTGWGFRRIAHGKDRHAYYHEKFRRGFPHLLDKINRGCAPSAGVMFNTNLGILLDQYLEPACL